RGEHGGDPGLAQGGDVVVRHDPAAEDHDVVETPLGELVDHTGEQRHVRAREHGEPDRVGVLLQHRLGHLLWGLEQAGVDDLEAGAAQRPGNALDAPVMAVEARLGDDDSIGAGHARNTTAVSPVAPTRPRTARTYALAAGGVGLALVLAILLFAFAVPA